MYPTKGSFYDAPIYYYDVKTWFYYCKSPQKFWLAHCYCVDLDDQGNITQCLGGIKWGFRFSYSSMYPIAIMPSSLFYSDWQTDEEILSVFLSKVLTR